jgi:hypothetical protein
LSFQPTPRTMRRDRANHKIFFHPDYTVGAGITPGRRRR